MQVLILVMQKIVLLIFNNTTNQLSKDVQYRLVVYLSTTQSDCVHLFSQPADVFEVGVRGGGG